MNSGWWKYDASAGNYPTKSGGKIYLNSMIVYYATETLAGEPVETGDHPEVIKGKEVGMRRASLESKIRSDDYALYLRCN